LVPAVISDHPGLATASPAFNRNIDGRRVEIVLGKGCIVRASTGLSDTGLMRWINVMEAARSVSSKFETTSRSTAGRGDRGRSFFVTTCGH
jgi:hypothetical protein